MNKPVSKIACLAAAALCAAAPVMASAADKPKPKAAPAPAAAPAADPGPAKVLGSDGAWTAYLAENRSGKVCYVVAAPEKSESGGVKRKAPMAMVTHRTADDVSNVVSFDEGYALAEDKDVSLQVGADKFTLFAKDDTAWARTSDLDRTIVAALAKERQAVVRAIPKRGRETTDIYALAGFAKALSLIDKACDVKR